jgi:hypothetical protein
MGGGRLTGDRNRFRKSQFSWNGGEDGNTDIWAGGVEGPTLPFISMSEAGDGCRGEGDSYGERVG